MYILTHLHTYVKHLYVCILNILNAIASKNRQKKAPAAGVQRVSKLSYSHLLMTSSNAVRFIVHPSIFPVCGRKPRELMRKIVKLNDAIYALTNPKIKKNSFETIQTTSISLCNSSICFPFLCCGFSKLYMYIIPHLHTYVKHLYVYILSIFFKNAF
jgi:hypothetical protein